MRKVRLNTTYMAKLNVVVIMKIQGATTMTATAFITKTKNIKLTSILLAIFCFSCSICCLSIKVNSLAKNADLSALRIYPYC